MVAVVCVAPLAGGDLRGLASAGELFLPSAARQHDPRLLVIDRLRAAEVGWGQQAGAPARGRLRLCGRLVPSVGPPLMPLRVKRHNLSA